MSEASKELVRLQFEEIFNRKNLAVCDEIMAEDFVEHAVRSRKGERTPGDGRNRGMAARAVP